MKIYLFMIIFSTGFAQQEGYVDSSKVRNPNLAWKLGLVPGLGQFYNGKYLKAIGFVGSEYYVINRFIELKEGGSVGLRNTYAWWIFGLYVWNIIDSYVDAHLSTFPNKYLESSILNDSLKVKEF